MVTVHPSSILRSRDDASPPGGLPRRSSPTSRWSPPHRVGPAEDRPFRAGIDAARGVNQTGRFQHATGRSSSGVVGGGAAVPTAPAAQASDDSVRAVVARAGRAPDQRGPPVHPQHAQPEHAQGPQQGAARGEAPGGVDQDRSRTRSSPSSPTLRRSPRAGASCSTRSTTTTRASPSCGRGSRQALNAGGNSGRREGEGRACATCARRPSGPGGPHARSCAVGRSPRPHHQRLGREPSHRARARRAVLARGAGAVTTSAPSAPSPSGS